MRRRVRAEINGLEMRSYGGPDSSTTDTFLSSDGVLVGKTDEILVMKMGRKALWRVSYNETIIIIWSIS